MVKPFYNTVTAFMLGVVIITGCTPGPAPSHSTETSAVSQMTDTIFWQEYHDAYPVPESVGSSEVRSIVVDNQGTVWIATATGVYNKKAGSRAWTDAIPVAEQGPSFSVAVDSAGTVWMSTWNNVYTYRKNILEKVSDVLSPVSALCAAQEGVYAAGPTGVWLCDDKGCTKKDVNVARSVRDIISDGANGIWLGSDVGLYHITPADTHLLVRDDQLLSAYVRGVASVGSHLWAAGLGGITILKDEKKHAVLVPKDGLPTVHVNCIQPSPEGSVWIGTDVGVVRYHTDSTHTLRFSRRWLLDDHVNDIAFDNDGTAWIATNKGVSAIRRKPMTLASKQLYFYDVLMRRHIREPWIAGQCRLPVAGDTTTWEPEDDDNDGEYTGNYLAMESFRYATTRSEDAKEKAAKAFRFLKKLQEVTETDGFFARTIVPANWTYVHDGNRTYTPRELADELVKEPRFKPVTVRWHKSKDGKWLWKGDTSSDEICGHMFGYFLYYELVADAPEKDIIRKHVAKIVDHLMKHGYTLTDIDGSSTRWGVWSPDKLNRDPEWSPDRSLNSMELLSFIKLAYYMTGNEKYQDEYLRLIKEERYLDNMSLIPHQNPAWFIYFDVILAAYQYPILLKCEKDPELLKFYEEHIDTWMEMRKGDKNPLINFIYCYARNKKIEIEPSVEFLKDTPLDLIDWTIDHSKREDITLVRTPVLDELQVSELQPASLRATVRWDKNPWSLNNGNHQLEREPVFWLLPYWMGRYLSMIR